MRPSTGFTFIALALLAVPSAAAAQSEGRDIVRGDAAPRSCLPGIAGACVRSTMTAEEETAIARRIEDATRMVVEGRLLDAKDTLEAVIREQRRARAYPKVALRHLANVRLALDRPLAAASTLTDLAREARRVGDSETELLATVDAAVLYLQLGRRTRARELMPRIETLLRSPAVPAATRRLVTEQLGR